MKHSGRNGKGAMRIFATSRPTADATPEKLAATLNDEIAAGMQFYRDGVIVQAYADAERRCTFLIVEAPSVEHARNAFATFPQVRAGLITIELVALIGLPAIARVHADDGTPLPGWWPVSAQ
jgi:hypothetical protein